MNVTMTDIKKLREMTGAGLSDCKKALAESDDMDGAVAYLRKKGQAVAAKRSDREAAEGCGLTPNFDEAAPYFEEAKLVLVCKKMAKSKFDPNEFIDDTVEDKWYPEKDFHYIYFAEIEKVLISE